MSSKIAEVLANDQAVPQRLIRAVVDSNRTREDFAAAGILACKPEGIEVIVCEPVLEATEFFHFRVINDLEPFRRESGVVVANRMLAVLANLNAKAFARDVFGTD